jgi:hypothetical protein
MWPNKLADGNVKNTTPGILSDAKESELEEAFNSFNASNFLNDETSNNNSSVTNDEFPILDEIDRLAKVNFRPV